MSVGHEGCVHRFCLRPGAFFVFSFWATIVYFLLAFLLGFSRQAPGFYLHLIRHASDFLTVIFFYGGLLVAMKVKIFDRYHLDPFVYLSEGRISAATFPWAAQLFEVYPRFFIRGHPGDLAARVWDIIFSSHAYESLNAFFQASETENAATRKGRVGLSGFALVFLIGPFLEELFFRGCLYRALRRRLNVLAAVLVSSFVFALMHGYFFLFFYVFLVGLSLAYLYEKTESLVAPLSFHMLNNLFVLVLFLLGL
jgi:membrane protease YdiL (CAAX protease family)